ncbi:hypothetical protein SAMN04489806_1085 [Paramicrobacterium humi]|uniref:Uncharacterized protein n=1 Tax=Paramicrobacterium humi TaxID=640635 RepID=A0A1H4KBD3_9MICO|nr:hypothetical protein [Microbacterium humi]SEB55338.1 hypothetical protein SAMN04489806_1085 [Microbacterium humi]
MTRHSAFGIANALGVDERAALEARIVHATRQGADLKRIVDRWVSGTTFTTRTSLLGPNGTGFNVYVEMSRPHPHDRWATIASSMAHASRAALDNLNDRLFARFANGSYDRQRISFPITTNGREWRKWRQAHRALPAWIIERYEAVQPWPDKVGHHYVGLAGLQWYDNKDKHVWLQGISLAPTEFIGSGQFDIEGLDPIPEIEVDAHDVFISHGQTRVHVATVSTQRRLVNVGAIGGQEIVPVLHFHIDGGDGVDRTYTLTEMVEIPKRVRYVLDYVDGNAGALAWFQSKPRIGDSSS